MLSPFTHPASGEMRDWGIFQLRYLATKLIHQPDKLAGVSIADSANKRPSAATLKKAFTKAGSGSISF